MVVIAGGLMQELWMMDALFFYSKLLNSEQNPERSDATGDDSSNTVGNKKIKIICHKKH
jgi:hypothetical protein